MQKISEGAQTEVEEVSPEKDQVPSEENDDETISSLPEKNVCERVTVI